MGEIKRQTGAVSYKGVCLKAYAKAGYSLIPLDGKRPVVSDWVNFPYQEKPELSRFPSNYGVVLKEDDLVIDADPRNYKHPSVLKDFLEHFGVTLDTYVVSTGGGGWHIYLKKPRGQKVRSQISSFQGIEFKSRGNQLVGPGSLHPDTHQAYKIHAGSPFKITSAPDKLLKELTLTTLASVKKSPNNGSKAYDDSQTNKHRYSQYLTFNAHVAVEGAQGDATTFKVACVGRDYGLSPEVTYDLMSEKYNPRCAPPWHPTELKNKVDNAYNYAKSEVGHRNPQKYFDPILNPVEDKTNFNAWDLRLAWDEKQDGKKVNTLSNVVNYFLDPSKGLTNLLCYNSFTNEVEFRRPAPWHREAKGTNTQRWLDRDAICLRYWLSNVEHFEVHTRQIHEAAVVVSQRHSFHPVRDYLSNLQWDGKERLSTWLTDFCGAESNPYTRAVGRKTLIAAVKRAFEPGCKFDHLLVLEGKQRIGKSTVIATLGGLWAGDFVINAHDKDTVDKMRGKWIVEIAEMEMARRTEVQALKHFLSCSSDRARLAYRRDAEDYPRQCIFIGSINPEGEGYLKDVTGNSRFWPVKVNSINAVNLSRDRDQLFAEALHSFRNGEPVYLEDRMLFDYAEMEAKKRFAGDAWVEPIESYLENKIVVTINEVWVAALGGITSRLDRTAKARISNIMEFEFRWVRGNHYLPERKKNVWGYRRPNYIYNKVEKEYLKDSQQIDVNEKEPYVPKTKKQKNEKTLHDFLL